MCEEARDAAKMHALCEEEEEEDDGGDDAETHTCTAVQTRARLFEEHGCFALISVRSQWRAMFFSCEAVRASHRC